MATIRSLVCLLALTTLVRAQTQKEIDQALKDLQDKHERDVAALLAKSKGGGPSITVDDGNLVFKVDADADVGYKVGGQGEYRSLRSIDDTTSKHTSNISDLSDAIIYLAKTYEAADAKLRETPAPTEPPTEPPTPPPTEPPTEPEPVLKPADGAVVSIVGMTQDDECGLGSCAVIVWVKPYGTSVGLLSNAPIYKCWFNSTTTNVPLELTSSVATAAADGLHVACQLPASNFPDATSGKPFNMNMQLTEGIFRIPWEDGSRRGKLVDPPVISVSPVKPIVSFESTKMSVQMPDSYAMDVTFNVTDTDTDKSKLTLKYKAVGLVTGYTMAITSALSSDGSTHTYGLNLTKLNAKFKGYTLQVLVTALDNNGMIGSTLLEIEFISDLLPSQMPPGSSIQLQHTWSNIVVRVTHPHYNNNINNLRATPIQVAITSLKANSKFLIQSQFVMRPDHDSHNYVDIWRSVNGGNFQSLAATIYNGLSDGENADGLMSNHPYAQEASSGEHQRLPFVLDNPRVAAGAKLVYKIYVGQWGNGYIDIGSHSTTNDNGRSPELMVAQEIVADDNCVDCVDADLLPEGTLINTAANFMNVRTRIATPHYGNNINNFRPTPITVDILTKTEKASIFVESQFTMRCDHGSHNYLDIWRSINGASYVSLAKTLFDEFSNENADGLVSHYPESGEASNGENGKHVFVVDNPNVPAGTKLSYKVYVGQWGGGYIDLGSHDVSNPNGRSPEIIIAREIVMAPKPGAHLRTNMPAGSSVQLTKSFYNFRKRIENIPSYNNIITNFRPTGVRHAFTTAVDNSKIFVRAQFTFRTGSCSHVYVDIWRSVNNGNFESVAQIQANSKGGGQKADGLVSQHGQGCEFASGEHAWWPLAIDEPKVKAGTKLIYEVYIGLWSGSYVDFGSHDSTNPNGRSPEILWAQEYK